jgi:hypothetical protein
MSSSRAKIVWDREKEWEGMTDWQKKYNKCWPGVLSEEAIARIEKAFEEKAIFLPSGDPADPHYRWDRPDHHEAEPLLGVSVVPRSKATSDRHTV